MNATTTPARASTVAAKPTKTVKAATPIATEAQEFFVLCQIVGARVQTILCASDDLVIEGESINTGNTFRLARIAAQTLAVFEPARSDTEWTTGELAETLFDAIALLDAAYNCPGDSICAARIALYDEARAMLCELLDGTEYGSDQRGRFDDRDDRREICRQSISELAYWLSLIEREHERAEFQRIVATVFNRADTLCSVILSALEDEMEPAAAIGARLEVEAHRHCVRGEA